MDAARYSAAHFEPVAQMRRLAKIPLEPLQEKTTGFVPVILRLPSNPSSRADDELLKLHLMTDANLDLDDELAKLDAEANGMDEYDVMELAIEKKPIRTSNAKRTANSKRTDNSDKASAQSSSLAKYYTERKPKPLANDVNKPSRRTEKQRVKDKELKQEQDAQDSSVSGHSRFSQTSGHNMRAVPRSVSECDSDSLSSTAISQPLEPSALPPGDRTRAKETKKQRSTDRKSSPSSHDLINRKSKERQRKNVLTEETELHELPPVDKSRKSTERKRDKDAMDSNNSGISRLSRMSGRNMRAIPRNDSRHDSDSSSLAETDPDSIISVSVIRRSASPVPPRRDRTDAKETRRRLNSLQSVTPGARDRNLVEQMKEERRREKERQKDRELAQVVINNMHKDISSRRRTPNGVNEKTNRRQSRAGGAKSVDGYSGYESRERYGVMRGPRRPVPVDTRETNEVIRPRPCSAKTPGARPMKELLAEMSVKDRESVLLALKDELKLYRDARL